MSERFTTPLLFLIFNRAETTVPVFQAIRQQRPARLFIAADGPRENVASDLENCQKARAIIGQVDWDCEVHTLLREKNLGCKDAISSAISWFFSHNDEGIILEDDCLPDPSFFAFCQKLLEKYREDKRIMMIAGTNYFLNQVDFPQSYYFSRYYSIWGWATWRRAWQLYDIRMNDWDYFERHHYLEAMYSDKRLIRFLKKLLEGVQANKLDTWDVQWTYSCIFQNGLSVTPKYNLITNIGSTGTHFNHASAIHFMPLKSLDIENLCHPAWVVPNFVLDGVAFDRLFAKPKKYTLRTICGKLAKIPGKTRQLLQHFFGRNFS